MKLTFSPLFSIYFISYETYKLNGIFMLFYSANYSKIYIYISILTFDFMFSCKGKKNEHINEEDISTFAVP